MGTNVIISREEFYLNTGRILTNNRELLNRLVEIERMYNFGENPTKEMVLHGINLVKEQQKVIQELTESLREYGVIHNIINENKED